MSPDTVTTTARATVIGSLLLLTIVTGLDALLGSAAGDWIRQSRAARAWRRRTRR
jgi:hypothetical protein